MRSALGIAVTLLPQLLAGCTAQVTAMRERLGGQCVLARLRQLLARQLSALVFPLGFGHRRRRGEAAGRPGQQHMGPDPPA